MSAPRRRMAALAAGLLAAACSGATESRPVTLTVQPSAVVIEQTDSVHLAVSAVQDSQPVVVALTFGSSDTAVARVTPLGWVIGVGKGQAMLTVSSASGQKTVPVTVTGLVATVQVLPADTGIKLGATATMRAVALDAFGQVVTGLPVTFSAVEPTRLTVTTGGAVTGLTGGIAHVQATVGHGSGTNTVRVGGAVAAIRVTPPDTTIMQSKSWTVRAWYIDHAGDSIGAAQPIVLSLSDSGLASVTPAGLVTALGAGTVNVRARGGTLADSARAVIFDTVTSGAAATDLGTFDIAPWKNGKFVVVSHLTGSLRIFDAATGSFTGTMATGAAAVRVAVNAATDRAYVADLNQPRVVVINLATLAPVDTIPLPRGTPAPIVLSADGSRLFVPTNANVVYRVDPATHAVQDSVLTAQTSHQLLMHPNDTLLYVATRAGATVLEINRFTMAVVRTFSFPGSITQGMAIANGVLYVADEVGYVRTVTLSSGATGQVLGARQGYGAGVSADQATVFITTLNGRVYEIDTATRAIRRTVIVSGVPRNGTFAVGVSRMLVADENGGVLIIR